ncbi:MAG: hypothetical protein NVS9B12_08310 [Vulcanimicrobiaceae bacterium]
MKPKDTRAPGDLEVIRAFVNTINLEAPERDLLAIPAAASGWLRENRLLPAAGEINQAGLVHVLRLREGLRSELLAHTGDGNDRGWPILSELSSLVGLGVRLNEDGTIELTPEGEGAEFVAARLFAIMYDAIRLGLWRRLKACRKESCVFAFFDHSKNGSGAWCDMAICGNRVKAQRRRLRQAG